MAEEPLKVTGEIIQSIPDEPGELPKFFHPRRRSKIDYYGVSIPEYLCYATENLSAKLCQMDSTHDRDTVRIILARLHKLSLSVDVKCQVMAMKCIMDLAGLAVAWEHKKKPTEINVQVKLSDLILEASQRLKLVKSA